MQRWKRVLFWQLTLLPTYGAAVVLLVLAVFVEAGCAGPYTRWYNHRLKEKADRAGLLGAAEPKVVEILGAPDHVWRTPEGPSTGTTRMRASRSRRSRCVARRASSEKWRCSGSDDVD